MVIRRFDEFGHLVSNNLTRTGGVVFGDRVDEWGRVVYDKDVVVVGIIVGKLLSVVRRITRSATGMSTRSTIVRKGSKDTMGDGLNTKVKNIEPKKTEVG